MIAPIETVELSALQGLIVARYGLEGYVNSMTLYTFSLPTKADKVPAGCDWIHEIKYDGYRMMLIRDQDRVRLISWGGHDWAKRFPLIAAAALKLRPKHFVIDVRSKSDAVIVL
jgi:hypothetical protein